MRRSILLAAGIGALASCGPDTPEAPRPAERAAIAAPGASGLARVERPVPDQYIVVFRSDRDPRPDAARLAQQHGAQVLHVYRFAVRGFAARMNEVAAAAIARDPAVLFVEEDGEVEKFEAVQSSATWGLDRIDETARVLDGLYHYASAGSGVHAYVIDTGIHAAHPDFGGRVGEGFTAISDGRGTNDCDGHGTHVAGTIGSSTWGVAKQVQLHPVRVLNCRGSGTWAGVIAGVDWVTGNAVKPAVANMSLGGGAASSVDTAVNNSIASGITYAIAAGNSSADACNYSPARVGAALTVGATTSGDAMASYSNFGRCVDLFAPGSSITSTWNDGGTSTISGTSMATPHVAGAAALYLGNGHGGASASEVGDAIVGASTAQALSRVGSGTANLLLYAYTLGGGTAAAQTAIPTFSPAPGTYSDALSVMLSDATAGALIYYTLDGSTPTTSSTTYGGPIAVSATTTVKAIAVAPEHAQSAVAIGTYTIQASQAPAAATPTFDPPAGGSFPGPIFVTIADATPAAAIYYTTDGSTPTMSSPPYTGPVPLSASATLKAIATAPGFGQSAVANGKYNIRKR
jgi:subtilisin family serine protease